MIEINQLQQFICIVENGTISKAAETLHISQPALSRSMQKLEKDLSLQLFEHHKNKIILTSTGEHFLNHAKKLCSLYDSMIIETKKFEESIQTIKVASCTLSPLWELLPVLSSLYPSSKIQSELFKSDDYLSAILNGSFDMIITPVPFSNNLITCIPFLKENLFLSVPKDHHLATKNNIHFSDLSGETMLLYSNIGFWRTIHQEKTPHTRYLIQDERSTFNEIVKSTSLLSYTSDLAIKREGTITNRVIIPIDEKEAHVSYYISFLKSSCNKYTELIPYLKKRSN